MPTVEHRALLDRDPFLISLSLLDPRYSGCLSAPLTGSYSPLDDFLRSFTQVWARSTRRDVASRAPVAASVVV